MWDWPAICGGVLAAFLIIYSLTGGADYGGGVWDLFARGPRAKQQRELIARAIGPIWEANHVWLIAMIVVLFSAFPKAFALMGTHLHLPLAAMLFGIIMRGSAFVFRAYGPKTAYHAWSRVFAIASLLTPVALGIALAALSTGAVPLVPGGSFATNYVHPWFSPFSVWVGLLVSAIFAFLAATYLTCETADRQLASDFRRRAILAGALVGVLGQITLLSARSSAPRLFTFLTTSNWGNGALFLTAIFALLAIAALWRRTYRAARVFAVLQISCMILGWAWHQYPYLIYPNLTIYQAAAPESVLKIVIGVLMGGSLLLIPSFIALYRIFSHEKDYPPQTQGITAQNTRD